MLRGSEIPWSPPPPGGTALVRPHSAALRARMVSGPLHYAVRDRRKRPGQPGRQGGHRRSPNTMAFWPAAKPPETPRAVRGAGVIPLSYPPRQAGVTTSGQVCPVPPACRPTVNTAAPVAGRLVPSKLATGSAPSAARAQRDRFKVSELTNKRQDECLFFHVVVTYAHMLLPPPFCKCGGSRRDTLPRAPAPEPSAQGAAAPTAPGAPVLGRSPHCEPETCGQEQLLIHL